MAPGSAGPGAGGGRGPGPPVHSPRRPRPLRRAFWRMSLRARLIAAFLALIVTSASATIVIGNVVLGQTILELALSKMEIGLKAAQLGLDGQVDRLRLLARIAAKTLSTVDPAEEGGASDRVCELLALSGVGDFAVVSRPGGGAIARVADDGVVVPDRDGEGAAAGRGPARPARRCVWEALPAGVLAPDVLGDLAARTRAAGEPVGGLLALPPPPMRLLGYGDPPPEGLFLVAGAPLADGGTLLLAGLANGRADLVAAPLTFLWPEERRWHEATIFLGDTRVATTIGEGGLGTHVDAEVVDTVLRDGEVYLGAAEVVGESFYTAYLPLPDFRGRIIGILGFGAREEVYTAMRNRTITLFSALIALGMIFGFVMTYLVSAWLIRPVSALAKGMDRVARGDLEFKVRMASTDELGMLARSFNVMVRNIKERDIRLHEMTDERLSHVEKQVSIGRLAAGVAHEINNPLTSVLSLSMLLHKELSFDDPRRQDIDIIVEETTRCRDIVRSLLDFARERPPEKRIVDLNQVIRETLVLARRYEGVEQLTIVEALSEEPLYVSADPHQLQQVFTNVITNAAEASVRGGTFSIVTDEDSSGGFVVAQLIDTGKGMSPADLARVFEPFFTTKGERKGTGLGLSVSLGIVRRHGGTIEIDSEEGVGTTVTVQLPRVLDETRYEE